jgi:hypothetical protein
MSFNPQGKTDGAIGAILLFANINSRMKMIREVLAANPAVASATRGCDVSLYRESCYFEAYVEADPHSGELFTWSLDVILTSGGWTLDRSVGRRTRDGEDPQREFEDFTSREFSDLADRCADLMAAFEDTARTFDFDRK